MDKDLDYLFNNVHLYTKEEFNVFELKNNVYELNRTKMSNFVKYIGMGKDKIITYCHKCKKEFPFKIKMIGEKMNYDLNHRDCMVITKSGEHTKIIDPTKIFISNGLLGGAQPPYDQDMLLNNVIWYINYNCKCTNKDEHQYMMMISIELKDDKFVVRKIGQNPSMITIKGFDFDKYEKILRKLNAYQDYKKADLSNAEHFHVGAYAYLRRIFEKMVNYYLEKKTRVNSMDKKIEAVKDKFDPRVRHLLRNLYGILSVSIHELDEEQSREYYEYLKAVIDMQLEYMNTEEEKAKQSKKLESIINKITNLVNKK